DGRFALAARDAEAAVRTDPTQGAWAERLKDGIDGMTRIAIAGKGAMPPRGGTQASDAEIRAAVEYMANAVK
ncbi:c-type cytochrome, partial [Paracidovorax avenae]|uniref:c-type cytochrome n=1 Tax=Paracidovorax avenae TaxID=80867 RepID=UPI001F197230